MMQFQVKVIDNSMMLSCSKDATKSFEFPLIWLRDNCLCDVCYNPATFTRIIDWDNFNIDVSTKRAHFNVKSNKLEITWQDNHESSFPSEWLIERNFSLENRQDYLKNFYRPEKKVWSKNEFAKIFKSFDFNDVIENDKVLMEWLDALAKNGIAMLKNTPDCDNQVNKLGERVRFIKKTHYGDNFIVKAKPTTSTFAYTTSTLQLHTDIPYYEYMPSINLLHCLVQSKSHGGRNTVIDGLYIAGLMKQQYPELFDVLTRVLVNWCDIGNDDGSDYYFVYRAPVICLNQDGEVIRINRSITQRDSVFTGSCEDVSIWYRAMARFVKLMKDEEVEFKMETTDTLTFDNIRLCHGRSEYVDSGDNARTLIGAYLDWDLAYAAWRILHRKYTSNEIKNGH